MNRYQFLSATSLAGLVVTMIINAISISSPINGYSTVELSDSYPNLFVPAGQTFSIWGFIYLALIIFVFIELYRAFIQKKESGPSTKIAWLFLLSCCANVFWIFTWHYLLIEISLVSMLVLFITLIMIYETLKNDLELSQLYWARIPFSIYLGWLSIAFIANITALLVHLDWSGMGIEPAIWVVLLIGFGTVMGLVYLLRNNDIFLPLAIAWACYGIFLKRSSPKVEVEGLILTVSIGACAIILLLTCLHLIRKRSIY